jgi:hypothetical protein
MLIVLVHNDGTGTEVHANYDYEVRINNDVIERRRILDHPRKDGWQELIREIADRHRTSATNISGSTDENLNLPGLK